MKTIGLLLWLTLRITVQAPSAQSRADPPFTAAAGGFFALSVADLRASASWYSEKLGLKIVMQAPKRDGAAVIVLEGGGLIVELVQLDDAGNLIQFFAK